MTHYEKLIRDRILEIIEADGRRCEVRTLDEQEYGHRLDQKLDEEVAEYRQTGDIAELADLVEGVQALVERQGMDWEAFEMLRTRIGNAITIPMRVVCMQSVSNCA